MSQLFLVKSSGVSTSQVLDTAYKSRTYLGWNIKITSNKRWFGFQKDRFSFNCSDPFDILSLSNRKSYPSYNAALIAAQKFIEQSVALMDSPG